MIMNLNLVDISKIKQDRTDFIANTYKGVLSFPEDDIDNCTIDVSYKLSGVDEGIYMSGFLSFSLNLLCSRCVKDFNYKEKVELNEFYDYNIKSDDLYDNFLEEESLNLQEILRQKIILFLPSKPLCDDSCKGLCAKCGMDLNESKCKCESDIDPRWTKLSEILK